MHISSSQCNLYSKTDRKLSRLACCIHLVRCSIQDLKSWRVECLRSRNKISKFSSCSTVCLDQGTRTVPLITIALNLRHIQHPKAENLAVGI